MIALFPEIPSSYDGRDMSSYMHIGQHGGARYEAVWPRSTPAKLSDPDVKELKRELEQIGYKLKVVQRYTERMQRTREMEARRT